MFSRLVRSAIHSAAAMLAGAAAQAEVTPAVLFADGIVLQRDRPLPVWGRATPGERVTVAFAGQTIGTVTGPDGRWIVFLAPVAASSVGTDLTIAGKNTVIVRDALVGDVWLCAGGANMEIPFGTRPTPAPATMRAAPAPNEADVTRLPFIRQWRPPAETAPAGAAVTTPSPLASSAAWQSAVPPATAAFTAVGFAFAREVHARTGVPIGLISVAAAGSPIERWLPPTAEAAAGTHFSTRLAPLLPAALCGVLWYHGEDDVGRAAAYDRAFTALVSGWRTQFAQPDLPFFWVNLAAHAPAGDHLARGRSWAHLRDAQTRALALPHTAQAVAIDLADPKSVVAVNHAEVGRRLALLARRQLFGATLDDSGPVFVSATREGPALRVAFSHADTGLIAHGKPMSAVEIAGADRVFHVARVRLDRDTLLVSSPAVPEPVAVRYAWSNAPDANLFNGAGLPARPFRSDDW